MHRRVCMPTNEASSFARRRDAPNGRPPSARANRSSRRRQQPNDLLMIFY